MEQKELTTESGIRTVSWGSSQGENKTPLVLVHGSWGASWMWGMYVKYLVSQGWSVHALDLRGHGGSSGSVEGATMNDYLDDIHSAVEVLDLENPVIIGHSMSGLLALMYGSKYPTSGIVSIDPSASKEVRGEGQEVQYPPAYTPMDAGMPKDPKEAMAALADLSPPQLMMMKEKLGKESGVARSERKAGVSVSKESIKVPLLFLGGEMGESVEFGIGIKGAREMAEYYGGDVVEVKGATHPGILVGAHAHEAVEAIEKWLHRLPS